jgi:hypothetical protein
MRLVSRLFMLLLLVTIFILTNLISPPSKADDGSVCKDACDSQYDLCYQRCGDTNSSAGQAL